MGIWSLPFIAVLVISLLHVTDLRPDYWLIVFPLAIGALGVFLLYTAVLSDDAAVERRTEFLSEGGEVIGAILIIVVIIVALPIWELLKLRRADR